MVFDAIVEIAEAGQPMLSSGQLADRLGLRTQTVCDLIGRLEERRTIKVYRGRSTRIIEIAATGARTGEGPMRAQRAKVVRWHDKVEEREPEPPRVARDPCFRCGVRGDIGCQHRQW